MTRTAALCLTLLAIAPAPAGAATVKTEEYIECGDVTCSRYETVPNATRFVFAAAPGERNDVVVGAATDGRVRIVDRGAPLEPSAGCEAVSEHEVLCRASTRGTIALGDGDDAAALGEPVRVHAIGGDGNDVLTGSAADEVLAGGPGADRIAAGGGADELVAPEPADVVDGGDGAGDVATFRDLPGPAEIRLDRMPGVEDAVGSRLGDLLVGTSGPNRLEGGGGADIVIGGGGDDVLEGNAGFDLLRGDAGDDTLRTYDGEADDAVCGAGRDVVVHLDEVLAQIVGELWSGPDPGDRLARDCERVGVATWADVDPLLIDPRVRAAGRAVLLANPCRTLRARRRCRGTMTVHAAAGRRTRRFGVRGRRLLFLLPPSETVRVSVTLRRRGARVGADWTAER